MTNSRKNDYEPDHVDMPMTDNFTPQPMYPPQPQGPEVYAPAYNPGVQPGGPAPYPPLGPGDTPYPPTAAGAVVYPPADPLANQQPGYNPNYPPAYAPNA